MDRRYSVSRSLIPAFGIEEDRKRDKYPETARRSNGDPTRPEKLADVGGLASEGKGRSCLKTVAAVGRISGATDSFDCGQGQGNQDPDSQLIEAVKGGDLNAFSELTARHSSAIYRRMFRMVRNREDAEDLVQETLLSAYNHLDRFRGTARFSTWLFRIGVNSALQLLRKRRRIPETSLERRSEDDNSWETMECPDIAPNAEQLFAKYQASCLLSQAFKRLPPSYQEVVWGHHEEERSVADVAHTLGISVSAAKARLFRARITLRAVLKEGNLTNV